jgi:hypothetical protein
MHADLHVVLEPLVQDLCQLPAVVALPPQPHQQHPHVQDQQRVGRSKAVRQPQCCIADTGGRQACNACAPPSFTCCGAGHKPRDAVWTMRMAALRRRPTASNIAPHLPLVAETLTAARSPGIMIWILRQRINETFNTAPVPFCEPTLRLLQSCFASMHGAVGGSAPRDRALSLL